MGTGYRRGAGVAIGKLAMVWDGEVNGILNGIKSTTRERKVLILPDSQAAINAGREAGRTRKARTKELKEIVEMIAERQGELGQDAVNLGWVKAHIGIEGNEKADERAKAASTTEPATPIITEGT